MQAVSASISPQVVGQIVSIAAKSNTQLGKDAPLFNLDPEPYRFALANAHPARHCARSGPHPDRDLSRPAGDSPGDAGKTAAPTAWQGRSGGNSCRSLRSRGASEALMSIKQEFREAREKFRLLSLYQRFEHFVVMFLTALIVVIVVAALWSLTLKILFGLVLSGGLDPSDYSAFQAVFGMILTVIIALEFKKSLLVVAESRDTAVQIRSVVMIALLAICRKVIILDLTETDALHILALATAILALGLIYWLIGVRDREGDEAA
jgi:uncharacterized membrane protein (DUF373 family)